MLLLLGVSACVFVMDGASKALASALLKGESLTVLDGLLVLRLTHNDGMALGMMSGNQLANLLLPLAVIVGGWFLLSHYAPTPYTRTASGLILGGFLGNFLQRLFVGHVVDMLYFPFMPWFVCNVADIAICGGVAMLVVSIFFRPGDWRERHEKDGANRPS